MTDQADFLDAECVRLNNQYLEIGAVDWTLQMKFISVEVWKLLNTENVQWTKSFRACVARAVVFWNKDQKLKAIRDMWLVVKDSDDLDLQNSLGSIIEVTSNYFEKEEVLPYLPGIDKLDTTKKYGIRMVDVYRRFGR